MVETKGNLFDERYESIPSLLLQELMLKNKLEKWLETYCGLPL